MALFISMNTLDTHQDADMKIRKLTNRKKAFLQIVVAARVWRRTKGKENKAE